jgi:predicted dehydrogenase
MKIGILGYGSIGRRHTKNATALGHQTRVYDPQIGDFTREHVIGWADAIIVASPTEDHVIDLHDSLASGKHVLVEKPIGYDSPNTIENIFSNAAYDLIVATGFNLRFHSCVQETVRVLNKGLLGDIQCASFSVLQKSDKSPYLRDGVIRNWAVHEIDLAHFFFGEGGVIQCTAPMDDQGKDSTECFITMKFPSVADRVFIQADYYTDPQQRFYWIEGSVASIYVNLIRREIAMRINGEGMALYFQGHDSFDDNYVDELKTFINVIETSDHGKWLAGGYDGIRALRTVMAARKMAGLE